MAEILVTRSAAEWLTALFQIAAIACVSGGVGAVIGRFFHHQPFVAGALVVIASLSILLCCPWVGCTIAQEWSWDHPIATAIHNFVPLTLWIGSPATIGALTVASRRERQRRRGSAPTI